MTECVISDVIDPTDEITASDGSITTANLLNEVNLYNLYDKQDSPEKDAQRILDITYPTNTLLDVIDKTIEKLDPNKPLNDGAHVIGGSYGSGKSHIELVVYHLLDSPEIGDIWLDQHDISRDLPAGTRTAALQMLNLDDSYHRLWEAVGSYLDIDEWKHADDVPVVHEIRDTLADTPTAIMIDEFERWFGMRKREEYTEDNLAFLQNLLEAAGRKDTPLVVHVSILYQNKRVEDIATRTNPFLHDLNQERREKIEFILHRLIDDDPDTEKISTIAKEYTDVYRQNQQIEMTGEYQEMRDQIEDLYPFHPFVLHLLIDKFSEQHTHQDARGLLTFLTEILADNYNKADLILTGDVDVFKYVNRFQYIDSELVGKYTNDYHRLAGPNDEFPEYVEELLNIVLLHSLARAGEEGANKRDILVGMVRKGMNALAILQTFTDDVYGHAWHIHRINGEYAFDVDENPSARIQKKAEDIHKKEAIQRVESLVKEELYESRNNVYIFEPVRNEQQIPDNKTLKIVVSLSAKQNHDEDFEALTTEQNREYQNTIALVTPQKRSSVNTNTGIIELARKVVAGEQLERDEGVLPEGFRDIHEQNHQNLRDRVADKYGTVHTSTARGLFPQNLDVPQDQGFYRATIDVIRPDTSQLRSEVRNAVEDAGAGGIQYQHLKNDFYRNPKYSTLTSDEELEAAIGTLCQQGELQVGSYFEQRIGSIGDETTLVHEKYLEDEEEEPEPETITIDTTGDSTDADTTRGSDDEDMASGAVQAFRCPQCGEELEGTICDCGFEFDATDIEDGAVTVEGGSVDSLLEKFDDLKEEVEEQSAKIERYPYVGEVNAGSKAELIDQVDREVGVNWDVHKITLKVEATIGENDLEQYGISDAAYADAITIIEEINVERNETLSKQDVISLLRDLSVPERASLKLKGEVTRHE